ncbi:transposase family protein [Corynebacterium durum]
MENRQVRVNHSIGQIRYVAERAIANMKTWRILHTDCRVSKEKS